jgi:hypothetical protein
MTISQADPAPTLLLDPAGRRRSRIAETRALIRLATPIALIALVNMGMSVTDTVMVSAIFGTDALAAVAVGSDLYSILFYLCAGILGGITPFYTGAVARGDGADRARLLRIGWASVGLLALLGAPLIWCAPFWLQYLGLAPHLLDLGRGYTQAMALTLIPMLGVMLYRTVLTAAEKPKVFLKVTLAMLPLNALGNYIFMTGAGAIPAFGPMGAGLSTLLVAMTSLGTLGLIARRATRGAPSVEMGRAPFDWRGMAAVLRVGVPIGIATVTEVGIYLAATLYAATLGAADVAAHTLTLRVAGIAYCRAGSFAAGRHGADGAGGSPCRRSYASHEWPGCDRRQPRIVAAVRILASAAAGKYRGTARRLVLRCKPRRRRRGRDRHRPSHPARPYRIGGQSGPDGCGAAAGVQGHAGADALHNHRLLGGGRAARPLSLPHGGDRHHRHLGRPCRRHADDGAAVAGAPVADAALAGTHHAMTGAESAAAFDVATGLNVIAMRNAPRPRPNEAI